MTKLCSRSQLKTVQGISMKFSTKENHTACKKRVFEKFWDTTLWILKCVKKVRSAIHHRISIHHRIWKHGRQILAKCFAFTIHRLLSLILYNVWNQSWQWMSSQSYIFLGYGFRCSEKFVISEIFVAYTTFFFFFLKPSDSVYVSKDHIRWIASSFRISLSVKKVRIKPAIAWRWLYVGIPRFCTKTPKI